MPIATVGTGRALIGGRPRLASDLVAYWRLEEASGTRFDSRKSNDLTDNNTVGQVVGKVGFAANFVLANSETLSITNPPDLGIGGSVSFTIAFWLNLTTVATVQAFVSKGTAVAANLEYVIRYATGGAFAGRVICTVGGSSGFSETGASDVLSAGTWYFARITYDHTARLLSVRTNESTPGTVVLPSNLPVTTADFILGSFAGVQYLNGSIDEFGFWRRALTDSEGAILYNGGNGRTYEEILKY